MTTNLWTPAAGRELDVTLRDVSSLMSNVVACLNVWNDLPSLRATINSWLPYVSRVIAVDGAYQDIDQALSTDGTREFLLAHPQITVIDAPGLTQCEKRTRYLEHSRPGDCLFIVDADEFVTDGEILRRIPYCDVGWTRIKSNLYAREYGQPRIIRHQEELQYRGRHHWIYQGDRLLCTHQYGGPGYAHRPIDLLIENRRLSGRSAARLNVKSQHQIIQFDAEHDQCAIPAAAMSDAATTARESVQICMMAYRDDGLAPSRLHTAINRTTPHASLFFKTRPGPFDVPTQYATNTDTFVLDRAMATCDIMHYHGVMSTARRGPQNKPSVFHHHGTMFRMNCDMYMQQAIARNALVVLSNLELFSWVGDYEQAYFLPNPVPVARYRQLRIANQRPFDGMHPFRIAHSPSKPEKKGTKYFLDACARLNARGVPIEPVIIHDCSHYDALIAKSTCHAAFDSFWLGIQCSGLESAAMGMPVIAGDEVVAARYLEHFDDVPYTTAWDGDHLEHQIERLVSDTTFYTREAERVSVYTTMYHDESAVALRYLDLLDGAFHWRTRLTRAGRLNTRRYQTVKA